MAGKTYPNRACLASRRTRPDRRTGNKNTAGTNGMRIEAKKNGSGTKIPEPFQYGGGRRTRTFEVIRRLIYSQLPLPLGTLPRDAIGPHPPKRWLNGHG